jgi:hypothetical protein
MDTSSCLDGLNQVPGAIAAMAAMKASISSGRFIMLGLTRTVPAG